MNITHKIGITERGDAGICMDWYNPLVTNKVDGAVLITKKITNQFIANVSVLHQAGYKMIVHCTCTGFGGTALEPNVPNALNQIAKLSELIACGFPAENCVVRIDPIFPTEKGIVAMNTVLNLVEMNKLLGKVRVRFSIVDEYNHVKERYKKLGWDPIYTGFEPSEAQKDLVRNNLERWGKHFGVQFECCAEQGFTGSNIVNLGCVSYRDIEVMGLDRSDYVTLYNPQQRKGCNCLSCKTELLTNRHPCPNGCVYCYWKN